MRAATPGCERIPAPTSETFPRSEISSICRAPDHLLGALERAARRGHVVLRDGERELGRVVDDVLEDRVDVHVLDRDRVEDRRRRSGPVGNVAEREDDLVLGVRHRGDDRLLEPFGVLDPGSRVGGEGRPRVDAHILVPGDLDRAEHEHLRAGGGHLEHLLVRDAVELAGLGDDARVGREDAFDVRVDLARGAERRGESDGRRVGAAAPERRHVHRVAGEALVAGDEDDPPAVERLDHANRGDLADLRLRVHGVGDDPRLRARERHGLVPEVVHGHRNERAGDPLSGRQEHVELAGVRLRRDLVGELEQPVGRVAHRRDGRDDTNTARAGVHEPLRDVPDLVGVGDRRPAELHDDGLARRLRRDGHRAIVAAGAVTRLRLDG